MAMNDWTKGEYVLLGCCTSLSWKLGNKMKRFLVSDCYLNREEVVQDY